MTMTESELYKEIGSNIRELRKKRGFTQQALADRMGVTRTSITNLEGGKQRPSIHFIYALCDKLSTSTYDIFPKSSNYIVTGKKKKIQAAGNKPIEVSRHTERVIEKIRTALDDSSS